MIALLDVNFDIVDFDNTHELNYMSSILNIGNAYSTLCERVLQLSWREFNEDIICMSVCEP